MNYAEIPDPPKTADPRELELYRAALIKYLRDLALRDRISADNGDADLILTAADVKIQRFDTPLTAERLVTCPTENVYLGMTFRIIREEGATGNHNLNVCGLIMLAKPHGGPTHVIHWADIKYDEYGWRVTAYAQE
ncbi:MAG: hypothetical protein KAR06_04395 [Deltaproteobacteria bacterium]|nr:hypothetical protein [Deltaproteobacteria bacterium]